MPFLLTRHMELILDSEYWENRYIERTSRWDLGEVSPPIKKYVDSIENKELKILIPGGGNSWEAEYLFHQGFTNVYVIDIAPSPLQNLKNRVPEFPESHLLLGNFFELNDSFDLILEQTFFCAIHPKLRNTYVTKAYELLKSKGRLAGLLFDAPLNTEHPPFGGSKQEYIGLFKEAFHILKMDITLDSVESRLGRELFFEMEK